MTSRTIEGVTTTYSYDNIHQLITESRSGLLLEYTYDANGNRLSKTLNSGTPSTYTYADDDRLLTTPHGTITYDAAGRPTAYPTASGTKYFSWDYDDRLLGYSNTSGGTYVEAHKYNGAGARVEFSSGGTTRKDLRTGIGVTAPVVSSAVGGSTTVSYLPGIAEKRGSTKSYQHSGLKNVDAQSNASAAISATREYDAFGGVITGSGTTGTFNGPFGHAGDFGYQSEGSGLQLLGHRWYDPEVGRFLTPDPIQDGKNWFAYCDNNPLGRVDPAGLFYWPSLPDTDVRNDTGKPIVIIWDGADGNTYEGTLSAGNWLDNGIDYDWYLAGFTKDGRPIWRKLRQSCTNILTKNKDGSVGVELTFTTFFGGLAEAVYHGPGSSEYIGSGSKDGGKYYPPGFNGNRRPKPGGGLGKKPSGGSGVSLPPPSQTRNGWHPTGGQRYE
jgi:RHS repeat-associated protein